MPDFGYLKYIRVFGLEEDSEECFQGLGASAVYGGSTPGATGSDGSDGSDGGAEPDVVTLPEALWEGQNAIIKAEITYLQQLQKDFKARKAESDQHKSSILDFLETLTEEGLGKLIGGWVAANTGGAGLALAPIAAALTQLGVGMVFDELEMWLTEGNAMFEGLIQEDEAIEGLDMSVRNYEHRQSVLARHAQQISIILDQITAAEAGVRQGVVMQGGGEVADLIKKAFLTPQLDADGNLVEDREGKVQYEGYLQDALKDIAYRGEVRELPGGQRLHETSKIIEYSG